MLIILARENQFDYLALKRFNNQIGKKIACVVVGLHCPL